MWSYIKRKKWFVLIGVGILLIGFGVVRSRATSTEVKTYVDVTRESIEQNIDVPGRVDATVKANLKFLAGGKLVSLPVKEGDSVKKGTKIASVDAQDIQKGMQKSLNDYLTNRWDFEQGKDDRKDTALTDTVRRLADQSQFSLNNAVIDVELKNIALRNATLTSPIDGVVATVPVDTIGVQVISTDAFEIVDPNSLVFEAEVDEVDIGSIPIGTPVRILLDAYPDERLEGAISWIGLKAESSTKSNGGTIFPVRVSIPYPNIQKYRLGMNGTMTIITKHKENVLTVPLDATTVRDGTTYVMVKDPSNASKEIERKVRTGIENDDKAEIVEGLQEGEQVVIIK